MKNVNPLYLFIIFTFFCTGCSKEEILSDSEQISPSPISSKKQNIFSQNINQVNYPVRSDTEIIVSYKPNITVNEKQELRTKYGVIRYEPCQCTNQRIEKWEFKPGTDIEERLGDISDETGILGTDYQFTYPNENESPILNNVNSHPELIASMVTSNNRNVNIAVLDTGINLNKLSYSTPFLYNTSPYQRTCIEGENTEISGWDFVNGDNDAFDDHGHGTMVIDKIVKRLYQKGVTNYSILPVKVFNHLGKATTFDILCGYLFTVSKSDIRIINMSFGWFGPPSNLLNTFVQENSDILHVTSAGNSNMDNDTTPHYPSNISEDHLLAIGSYYYRHSQLRTSSLPEVGRSSFSHFGTNTVDYLSKGENIFFEDSDGNSYPISGTSYATPIVVAEAARYHTLGYNTPSEMKYQLWQNATVISGVSLQVINYDRIIE